MELLHHLLSDLRALYLPFPFLLKIKLDAVDDLLNQVDADRPLFTGFFQAIEDFEAIKSFSSPILLDDQWKGILCPLRGCESFLTAETFPPSTNRLLILAEAGIDHLAL
jgi:hypothetical protein